MYERSDGKYVFPCDTCGAEFVENSGYQLVEQSQDQDLNDQWFVQYHCSACIGMALVAMNQKPDQQYKLLIR